MSANGAAESGDSQVVDILGFAVRLTPQQAQERLQSSETAEASSQLWAKYAVRQRLPSMDKVKRLIRKGGIAHPQRTYVWLQLSGAEQLKAAQPAGYFDNLVASGEQRSKALQQIQLDLPRTFPEHAWLHGEQGQAALRAVLVAYSMHDPKAGYCQGLNFVAGTLLVSTDRQPETTFWLMVPLLGRILYPGMYAPWLPGYQVEMKALNKLVAKKLPQLHRHLDQIGCDMSILATDWFLCLFVTTLPHESSLRVLDCLFCEGAKVLYRMSLALLKTNQELLLSLDNTGELLHALKKRVCSVWAIDQLLNVAFKRIGGMPMARINKYRQQFQPEIDEMVREREANARRQEAREAERQQQQQQQRLQQEQTPQQQRGSSPGTTAAGPVIHDVAAKPALLTGRQAATPIMAQAG